MSTINGRPLEKSNCQKYESIVIDKRGNGYGSFPFSAYAFRDAYSRGVYLGSFGTLRRAVQYIDTVIAGSESIPIKVRHMLAKDSSWHKVR